MRDALLSHKSFLFLTLVLASAPAMAHPGVGTVVGFNTGLMHPLLGWDHLLAMLAVGLWATQQTTRTRWGLPAAFLLGMTAGTGVGVAALALTGLEPLISATVVILGVLIAVNRSVSLPSAYVLLFSFGAVHGWAHGVEAPAGHAHLMYGYGLLLTSALLHIIGVGLGVAFRRMGADIFLRSAGLSILAAGAMLMAY